MCELNTVESHFSKNQPGLTIFTFSSKTQQHKRITRIRCELYQCNYQIDKTMHNNKVRKHRSNYYCIDTSITIGLDFENDLFQRNIEKIETVMSKNIDLFADGGLELGGYHNQNIIRMSQSECSFSVLLIQIIKDRQKKMKTDFP